jgi:DNA-binding HxlR family transcriptional regulator
MEPSIVLDTARARSAAWNDPNFCPVEITLGVIGGRWKALILYNLQQGPARFNVLRRLIPGVTQRMLTQHLRELEADGLISRMVHAVVPPHVEYALTDSGRSLTPILDSMAAWGMANPHLRAPAPGRAVA